MLQKLKTLSTNLAVYGMGDVATHIVSFLLMPLFTKYLDPVWYGIWAMLLTASLVAKIVFRWGVDASFMRFFYDCDDDRARQRLASTIFFFLVAANGAILLAALLAAPLYSERYFQVKGQTLALQLTILSTFVGGFFFLPFHVFRIRNQARRFSVLTFARSATTVAARVVLVVGLRYGVMGLVLSELVITVAFAVVLLRWFVPLIRQTFSWQTLGEVLRFGLPRVPHGIAQQIVGPATDAYLMRVLLVGGGMQNLRTIGLYQVGSSLGLALKFFLSAFEYAWAPFYFQTMKEKDAPRTFALITTYGVAVLVLLSAGLSAVAHDLVRLMTQAKFHEAAVVVPWTTIAVTLQGVYLLTSIGMNITRHTQYLPLGGRGGRGCEHPGQHRPHSPLRHDRARLGQRHLLRGAGPRRLRVVASLLPGPARVGTPGPHRGCRGRCVPGRGRPRAARPAGRRRGDGARGDRGGAVPHPARGAGVLPPKGTRRGAADARLGLVGTDEPRGLSPRERETERQSRAGVGVAALRVKYNPGLL